MAESTSFDRALAHLHAVQAWLASWPARWFVPITVRTRLEQAAADIMRARESWDRRTLD